MVVRAGEYYGTAFKGYCGVTQGYLISPTILDVVVYALVSHWVAVVL